MHKNSFDENAFLAKCDKKTLDNLFVPPSPSPFASLSPHHIKIIASNLKTRFFFKSSKPIP